MMMLNKKIIYFLTIISLFSVLTACYYKDQNSANPTNYGKVVKQNHNPNARAYGSHNQEEIIATHHNTKLHLDPRLAVKVAQMNGVNSAIVAITDHNAYIAILIDNTAVGTRGSNSFLEPNNGGTSVGNYSPKGNITVNPRQLATGMNSYDTVEHHQDIATNFKQKIAERVRRLRPSVHEVHISANRDFINRMTFYSQQTWNGKRLDPYIDDFNELVTRIFAQPPMRSKMHK